MLRVKFYTDGSCMRNPGPGTFAWIMLGENDRIVERYVSEIDRFTTNNRMELWGFISAVERGYQVGADSITIVSDSRYLVDGYNLWLKGWMDKAKVIKNPDLWAKIWSLRNVNIITLRWVKGHDTDIYNIMADRLCFSKLRDVV